MADQYAYPGNQNNRYEPPGNQRRRIPACTPSRSGKNKWLEWIVFALFIFDVFCQFMTRSALVGWWFWWVALGDDVLVLMFIMFLITR